MRWTMRWIALGLVQTLAASCSSIPPFTLNGESSSVAPAGPKVASLTANLKCELWAAANSTARLPWYDDAPKLEDQNTEQRFLATERERRFHLKNFFSQVQYVADVQMILDVTQAAGVNPLAAFNQPYAAALAGVIPATGVLLSVNASFSEAGHRSITIHQAVDFARLNRSEIHPSLGKASNYDPRLAENLDQVCNNAAVQPSDPRLERDAIYDASGSELQGSLGIKESLATALIVQAMNDIGLQPSREKTPPKPGTERDKAGNYMFGVTQIQVDFTIDQAVGGGPQWTLKYFKGPSDKALSFSRKVSDKILITFVPVCIRQKYIATPSAIPGRYDFNPEPMVGSPHWINYLPPCYSVAIQTPGAVAEPAPDLDRLKSDALNLGRYLNNVSRFGSGGTFQP